MTVMVFEPFCSWMVGTVQEASVDVPSSVAVPFPPRLFVHLTR
jgi:hypothetical protein